jgi:hypothetical protein
LKRCCSARLPYPESDRLVVIKHREVTTGLSKPDIAIGDFVDLAARQQSFDALGGYGGFQSTLTVNGDPERVEGIGVTPPFFEALGVQLERGRVPHAWSS